MQPFNVKDYWINRYNRGGNSGEGSYGLLRDFKVNFINTFIKLNCINSLADLGCGDGLQIPAGL